MTKAYQLPLHRIVEQLTKRDQTLTNQNFDSSIREKQIELRLCQGVQISEQFQGQP